MTTGTKCCEHHREGLPYCVECAEESAKAHDKACALLAEARAEIENLQWRVSNEKAKAEAALALNDRALELVNEARADAEHWKAECSSLQRMVHEARAENESLRFIVRNQRCCRNCDNHASWNFDTCGFGESPTAPEEGPHCRRNDLKRWRPMEYRRAKEERGE